MKTKIQLIALRILIIALVLGGIYLWLTIRLNQIIKDASGQKQTQTIIRIKK